MPKDETLLNQRRRATGFTTIELMVAVVLVALIVTAISPLFTATSRSWEKDRKLKEQVQQARDAMNFMLYELKKTNGIMDGSQAAFATTAGLDSSYVIFGTSGDEVYLDNGNSGYTMYGASGTWKSGPLPGGFAGDYDQTTTGYATYRFNTVLPGDYDVYAYYIATSAVMNFLLFDDGVVTYATTYDQTGGLRFSTTSIGAAWDQMNRSAPSTRTALNLTAGGNDAIGISRASGASLLGNVDGFKLVYRGQRHKVFYLDKTGNRITYGNDTNDAGFDGSLTNNDTLLNNVFLIPATPFLQYFQADGVTAATQAKDVALIKIAFQLNDPTGNLPPYTLRSQVEIKASDSGTISKVVLNEINIQTPKRVLGFESGEGIASGMDNNYTGWATMDKSQNPWVDYGWWSMIENFNDGTIQDVTGGNIWQSGGLGTSAVENDASGGCTVGTNDCVYSITGNNSTDQRNNRYFYNSSQNYRLEFKFRVVAQGNNQTDPIGGGANIQSIFGFYLRVNTPATNARRLVLLQAVNKGGTKYVRLARYKQTGPAGYVNISGNLSFLGTYDDGNWHNATLEDVFGHVNFWTDNTKYMDGVAYNTSAKLIPEDSPSNNDYSNLSRQRAFHVWSNTHVHFDDIKIRSYDFKPVAYLTDFEESNHNWTSFSNPCLTGKVACNYQIGAPTTGPAVNHTPNGTNVLATNLTGNYPQNCEEDNYEQYAIRMQPSTLRWSFPAVHYWMWQDVPAAQTLDASMAVFGNTTTTYLASEHNVFPLKNGFPITTAANNYSPNIFNPPPGPFDGTNSDGASCLNGLRAWTNSHPNDGSSNYTEMMIEVPDLRNVNTSTADIYFSSDNTATTANGLYVDDYALYPGGTWEWGFPSNPPGACFSGGFCYATIQNGNYDPNQHTALETPAVVTPAYTQEVKFSWYGWMNFQGSDADGGYVEYSSDNGAAWIQIDTTQLNIGYDGILDSVFSGNELSGKNGYFNDAQTWIKYEATLSGTQFANKTMRFRFVFGSDNATQTRGWYIDDVQVSVTPSRQYDWIELYNPTPYTVDVNNWRISMEHSYQDTPALYDTISGDTAYGSGLTTIGPYGYAMITADAAPLSTKVYEDGAPSAGCRAGGQCTGLYYTIPAESSQARRLKIDDDAFGTLGLRNKFGKITLQDNTGRLIDYVGYNVIFYDDFEDYAAANAQNVYFNWSLQQWGNATHWVVAQPTDPSGPVNDYTRGAAGGGLCLLLNNGVSNENYNTCEGVGAYTRTLDLTKTTASNPATAEFYLWEDVDNNRRRDGLILEADAAGGANFVQFPGAPDPIQILNNRLDPDYYNQTINVGCNPLNGLNSWSTDRFSWSRMGADLQDFAGRSILLRFMFGSGNGTTTRGAYLDNVAVYYDWVNINSGWAQTNPVLPGTLERKNWQGNSLVSDNWGLSTNATAPNIGTPNQKNTVSP